jgi:hypothetical protein
MKCSRCELREAPEHDHGDRFEALCSECLLAVRPGLFRADPPQPGVAWHREFLGPFRVNGRLECTFALHPDAWFACRAKHRRPDEVYGFEDNPNIPFPTLLGQPLLADEEVPVGVLEVRIGAVTIRLPLARPK